MLEQRRQVIPRRAGDARDRGRTRLESDAAKRWNGARGLGQPITQSDVHVLPPSGSPRPMMSTRHGQGNTRAYTRV